MKRNLTRLAALAALGGWLLAPAVATADIKLQKKAKEAGFPAQSCLYCHNEKLPKKGATTHNDRGKWLIAEKQKRKATEIDASWLKDYVEPKR